MARVNCGYQILDHFNHFSNDRFSHFKIKIIIKKKNIFLEKKILIYGLGKSGIASYKFLKNKAKVYLFDDDLKKKFENQSNQRLKNIQAISKIKFNSITITGNNGKSTTAQILYEVLLDQKYDCRLVGNIGNPILCEKKITNNTFFVVEASSYQLDYSQLFTSKYSAILNINH